LSMPMTVKGAKLGRRRLRRVLLPTDMLKRRAKLAAGRPPSESARRWAI
jgi:hypothetical protein